MALPPREEEIALNEFFQETPVAEGVSEKEQAARITSRLKAPLDVLVTRIEPIEVQKVVTLIFLEFTQLLEHLTTVETALAKDKTLDQPLVLFELINTRASSLLRYIDAHATQFQNVNSDLAEVLYGTSFAINHELKRLYKTNLSQISSSDSNNLSRADLTRAYGLLNNCFRQSTITLAQVFNPEIDGSLLFSDYKIKVEQSVELYSELSLLLQRVSNCEKEKEILVRLSLINHVKMFRAETMHYLMYKDWETFEEFAEELIRSFDNLEDQTHVLHRFRLYLEALLWHVSMRADLSGQLKDNIPAAFIET